MLHHRRTLGRPTPAKHPTRRQTSLPLPLPPRQPGGLLPTPAGPLRCPRRLPPSTGSTVVALRTSRRRRQHRLTSLRREGLGEQQPVTPSRCCCCGRTSRHRRCRSRPSPSPSSAVPSSFQRREGASSPEDTCSLSGGHEGEGCGEVRRRGGIVMGFRIGTIIFVYIPLRSVGKLSRTSLLYIWGGLTYAASAQAGVGGLI